MLHINQCQRGVVFDAFVQPQPILSTGEHDIAPQELVVASRPGCRFSVDLSFVETREETIDRIDGKLAVDPVAARPPEPNKKYIYIVQNAS